MRTKYFPPGVLEAKPDLHADQADWFGTYLAALEEEPLYPASSALPTTFRCLCLPTWTRPSVVRIELHGLSWQLTGKQARGDGGFQVGRVVKRISRFLEAGEANRLADLLLYLRFWQLPTFVGDAGLDGTTWVLEGISRGRYHVVHRWCPEWGDTFGEFCLLLLNYCKFGRGESWGIG